MASERELIERIRRGDAHAKKELVDRYLPRVRKLVEIRVGADSDFFDDIVQNAMIDIFDGIENRFNLEKADSLGAYIYSVTNNKIKDHYKDVSNDAQLYQNVEVESLITTVNAEMMMEREEFKELLKNEISKLKEKYRIVLYLRYYEDMSIKQIAEKIELEPRRVSERLHYALVLLKENMKKNQKNFQYFALFL